MKKMETEKTPGSVMAKSKKWIAAAAAAAIIFTGAPAVLPAQYASAIEATVTVQAATKTEKALKKSLDKLIKSLGITSETKKTTALKKLFTELSGEDYGYKRVYGFKNTSGWAASYAKEMLSSKKGSCYHYAAAYAYAAKRATNYPVRICIGTSNAFNAKTWQAHAWVEIKIGGKWYTFDTNAARYSSRRKGKWYKQKSSAMKNKVYKTTTRINVTI